MIGLHFLDVDKLNHFFFVYLLELYYKQFFNLSTEKKNSRIK